MYGEREEWRSYWTGIRIFQHNLKHVGSNMKLTNDWPLDLLLALYYL